MVLEAWQLANGHRGVRRAVKLVHSKGVSFTETEARRLQREVCSCMRERVHLSRREFWPNSSIFRQRIGRVAKSSRAWLYLFLKLRAYRHLEARTAHILLWKQYSVEY